MADLRWDARDVPWVPNAFNFMQLLGIFSKIVCWRPSPGGLAAPHRGNPGSGIDFYVKYEFIAGISLSGLDNFAMPSQTFS